MRSEERGALVRFVLFYFGSTFILLSMIFVLIYKFETKSIEELTKANMKNFSFTLSSKIINAQMQGQNLDFHSLSTNIYKFALYGKEGKKVFGDETNEKGFTLEDRSPLGHLGIWKIVVEDDTFSTKLSGLAKRLFLGFFLSYLLITVVGYYLIKLFMRPIREARERIDNFIKDTTHELNTPITAIMMCANKESLKDEKNIDRLYLSTKRVSELYKDLTYLFLEDREHKKIEKFRAKDEIEGLMGYFELLAKKREITIKKSLDDSQVRMDREDFKRLVSNLLSNAVKYNKQRGEIEISLQKGTLKVRDTGIGFDEKESSQLFKRYYRATSQSGGFGMGLSIVQKICDEYGFEISVKSKRGEGSEFVVDFR